MTSVNRPTDIKAKEADVNRKLQVYGIATAFGQGKVPSNEQIDIALNSFLKSRAMATPSKKLSAEGQALVADFTDVVKQAQHLLLTKNEGNLLQDFIWTSQHIDGGNATTPGAPVDKATAKQHGNEALEGLRTLGTLIISNGQFRKLLNDVTILVRDIAGDAAQKAADKVNPSEEQLKQIDRPADDDTWHDVPNISTSNLKSQVKQTFNKSGAKDALNDAKGDASQAADPNGSRDPADAANKAKRDQEQGGESGVDGKAGLKAGASTLKQKAHENVPEETKEEARMRKQKTKNYLSKKMPQERRDQTIWRLRKMVVEIQGHSDYSQAINTLLNLAETYAGHANKVANAGAGAAKGAHADNSLKRAEDDLKTLIERFANGTSTEDFFDSLNALYIDADRDPELKSWFKQVDRYIRKCLQQQGYIMEDRATDEWNELYDRGNFLLRDRYRNHTDRIVDETKFLADQFDQDPLNKRFAESMQKLFHDLGNDEDGKPTFKPHLVKDLTDVIIPGIFTSVQYVPFPRIEYSDPMMDAIIENLVIESDNLMPNVLEVANDNYFRWGRKNAANKNMNSVMLSVSGVQMDLRDVSYYIKKKEGFPSLTDIGVADIFLGGTGFSFKIKLSTAAKTDRQNFFKIEKVDVDVKNFNIKLKQSKHKLLFKLFKPLMLKVMRPALQKIIEKMIKDQATELDKMLYQIKQEADRAAAEVKDDPEQAQNIYSRYVSAFQKKMMEGKKKAEQTAGKTTLNMAVTKEDSIFPQIHLPGGISSKATEYKQLAKEGKDWQSPIFKIGSAAPSTTIASAPKVTRKHHNVTEGGVRGPQNIGNPSSMSDNLKDPSAQRDAQTSGYSNGSALNTTGQSSNAAYATGTPAYGSTGNDNTSFSNQVDSSFNKTANGTGNGLAHGSIDTSNGTTPATAGGHTLFGNKNPVLTGDA